VENVGAEPMEIVLTLSEREDLAWTGEYRSKVILGHECLDRILSFLDRLLGGVNERDDGVGLLKENRGGRGERGPADQIHLLHEKVSNRYLVEQHRLVEP